MALFNRTNNNNNEPIKTENIQTVKKSILEGNYVEIQIPTITSVTDNVIIDKNGSMGSECTNVANNGVNTLWNNTTLNFGTKSCCISLGGRLFPYNHIECIMKHPITVLRYGMILKTGEIINFNFTYEVQCLAALEIFQDYGVKIIEE